MMPKHVILSLHHQRLSCLRAMTICWVTQENQLFRGGLTSKSLIILPLGPLFASLMTGKSTYYLFSLLLSIQLFFNWKSCPYMERICTFRREIRKTETPTRLVSQRLLLSHICPKSKLSFRDVWKCYNWVCFL